MSETGLPPPLAARPAARFDLRRDVLLSGEFIDDVSFTGLTFIPIGFLD